MSDIKTALEKLDVGNADHWTAAGLPSVGAVSEIMGEAVTRQEIANASPGFDRDTAIAANATGNAGSEAPPPAPTSMVDQQTLDEAAAVVEDEDALMTEGSQEEDAIALLERAVLAASQPRFKRNYDLHALIRQYGIQQSQIKESQKRLDAGVARREERRVK